jgi:hypothetical protein
MYVQHNNILKNYTNYLYWLNKLILVYSVLSELSSKPLNSIYFWSKNVSHSAYEKSETKMAAIDVH